MFLGCSFFITKPSATTGSSTIWDANSSFGPHANFIAKIDDYTTSLIMSVHASCTDVPEMPDTDVGFVKSSYFAGLGTFIPSDNIWINNEYDKPLAVYGHEYCRFILYTADLSLWSACSSPNGACGDDIPYGWAVEPMACCWQTAETLSLEFE